MDRIAPRSPARLARPARLDAGVPEPFFALELGERRAAALLELTTVLLVVRDETRHDDVRILALPPCELVLQRSMDEQVGEESPDQTPGEEEAEDEAEGDIETACARDIVSQSAAGRGGLGRTRPSSRRPRWRR